jgi:polyisoprenoid-binding protein YceI
MKKIFLFCLFIILFQINLAFSADLYKLDPNHTNVFWQADHFGFSSPSGRFNNIEGEVLFDEKNPQNSSVKIVIKAHSINTGIDKFDSHLKTSDFFSADQFPEIIFESSVIEIKGNNFANIRGFLTLRGIKKSIELQVKLNKIGLNPISQKKTLGISATTKIKRSDFDMKYGLPGIGDFVKINIEAEAFYVNELEKNKNNNKNEWLIDQKSSKLEFSLFQESSEILGVFKKYDSKIIFDKNDLSQSSIEIEVDMKSIDIRLIEALEVVKNDLWLAVEKFPTAIFKSNKIIASTNKDSYIATGDLTIKNKKLPINLNFTAKFDNDNKKAKVVGSATLQRSLFNIGNKDTRDKNISNNVQIKFSFDANKSSL